MSIFSFLKRNKVETRDSEPQTVSVNYVGQKKYHAIVNPSEAMKSSVVYRGLAILSDAVASVPLDIYRLDKSGYWFVDEKNPLHILFTKGPNARQNYYEFLEGIVLQMITYGNAYVYINRDLDYEPNKLTLLYPKTVYYNELTDSYIVTDHYNKISGTFKSDRIIHIKHKSLREYIGESVFDYAGKTIGLASAADAEAMSALSTGGKLKGIIASESSLSGFGSAIDSQVDTIRDNLQEEINSGKDILSLQSGAQFTPISQTMRDLQITDLKTTSLGDLARYFGISPVKLGITMGGNYVASLQDAVNFYVDTLNPLLCKIAAAFKDKLIPESVYRKYDIYFDVTTLPYFKEILTNYTNMINAGLMSINDVRKLLHMSFVDNGDKIFISTNTKPLEEATTPVDAVLETENK